MTRRQRITAKINISLGWGKKDIRITKIILLKIEAKDTKWVIKNTIIQERRVRTKTILRLAIFKAKPAKTPKVVAIPLPPLNPKNIVQLWPETQARLQRILIEEIFKRYEEFIKSTKNATQKKPLKRSMIKTEIPGITPNTLKAFVAPTFPEPNLRISIPLKILPKI